MIGFSKEKQIKALLAVLGSGIGAGFLVALFFLYFYNPGGTYQAKNVLLDPNNAFSLQFSDPELKKKSEGMYVFKGIYFSYFDSKRKQMESVEVSKEKYADFYRLVARENSLDEAEGSAIRFLFNQPYPAVLSLKVRSLVENSLQRNEEVFSEIDFVNQGDYYRVRLRKSGSNVEWIYFHHPKIYQEALNLFQKDL